jgi:hypothetical protein
MHTRSKSFSQQRRTESPRLKSFPFFTFSAAAAIDGAANSVVSAASGAPRAWEAGGQATADRFAARRRRTQKPPRQRQADRPSEAVSALCKVFSIEATVGTAAADADAGGRRWHKKREIKSSCCLKG